MTVREEKNKKRFRQLKNFKDGHKYFRDYETGQLALADESGDYPTDTDDGVLYVDFRQVAVVRWFGGEKRSSIAVISQEDFEDGLDATHTTATTKEELSWLKSLGMRVIEK